MTVSLKIEKCGECPNLKKARFYTADSWEHVQSWYCGKVDRPEPERTDRMPTVENSSLITHVERPSEEPKKIPNWCPLR